MGVIIIQAIEGVSLEIIHYVMGQVVPLESQIQCLTETHAQAFKDKTVTAKPWATNNSSLFRSLNFLIQDTAHWQPQHTQKTVG